MMSSARWRYSFGDLGGIAVVVGSTAAAGTAAEQQAERVLVVRDELEVGLEARFHLLARPRRGRRRLTDLLAQAAPDVVEELDVEVALGREVLVEHGLGNAR